MSLHVEIHGYVLCFTVRQTTMCSQVIDTFCQNLGVLDLKIWNSSITDKYEEEHLNCFKIMISNKSCMNVVSNVFKLAIYTKRSPCTYLGQFAFLSFPLLISWNHPLRTTHLKPSWTVATKKVSKLHKKHKEYGYTSTVCKPTCEDTLRYSLGLRGHFKAPVMSFRMLHLI